MQSLQTAISGLRASQLAINTFSNNIANAQTHGYSRQTVHLNERPALLLRGLRIGSGVEVSGINRIASGSVDAALLSNASALGFTDSSLKIARQTEAIVSPATGSLADRLQAFFSSAQDLQSHPEDGVQRSLFLQAAQQVASEFNQQTRSLNQLQTSSREELDRAVENTNQLLSSLLDTNRQIRLAQAQGQQPNDLLDQHQRTINELGTLIDITVLPAEHGFEYQIGNFSVNHPDASITTRMGSDGQLRLFIDDTFELTQSTGGLFAIQEHLNSNLSQVSGDLNQLAAHFMQAVDHVHATGLSGSGFQTIHATRPIDNPDVPLTEAGLPFAMTSGQIYVTVTNRETGSRQMTELVFDPTSQSTQEFADAISGIPNLQAVISADGRVSLLAQPGYEFDFAGRLQSSPDPSAITGDAAIEFAGAYTGNANDEFQFEVSGSGTVGAAADLTVTVTRASGEPVGTFNIGKGYAPGSEIELPDGARLKIDSGTLNDGDIFSTPLIADSDTTGVLAGLGINSLFEGTDAGSMQVRSDIVNDPSRLALSRNGDRGDGRNAQRLFQLHDQPLMPDDLDFGGFVTRIQTRVGLEVQDLQTNQMIQEQMQARLQSERDTISGVDPNEELVRMLQFQRSFEASLRVIAAVDEMTSELISIIR